MGMVKSAMADGGYWDEGDVIVPRVMIPKPAMQAVRVLLDLANMNDRTGKPERAGGMRYAADLILEKFGDVQ